MRLVASTSARARLSAARRFISEYPPATELLIVGATRGAADDFARELAGGRATFGLSRFSLAELASRAAAARLAAEGRVALSATAAEAVAARASFDAAAGAELTYLTPVARMPGFARALARTVHELRLAGLEPRDLRVPAIPGADDLAHLLDRIGVLLAAAGAGDRAALFASAADAWASGDLRWSGLPVVLLDVPLDSPAERRFAAAICRRASAALVTAPEGDEPPLALAAAAGLTVDAEPDDADRGSDLRHLRAGIFAIEPPPVRERAGDVQLFSAPGEGREALEIARRVLDEAARGVPFDQMAVFLRAPQHYVGLLEHAFVRAGVPAYFDRGTRHPDPAGRAFLALLACACERLSARRFDEYLSLGQVPRVVSPPPPDALLPLDELFSELQPVADPAPAFDEPPPPDTDDEAIVGGTLRAPWKWEELIVESAVVGGAGAQPGRERWRRRLTALAADYQLRVDALSRDEPESPRIGRYRRDLRNLEHLRAFALPIVDELAGWPDSATWGDWLDRLTALAPRVLRRSERVLRALADLRPMSAVGPVTLDEVRDVLQERLLTLDREPPARRYGQVFVGGPHQARGRVFRVVFVPGLAERVFPQRLREDPLLLDEARRALGGPLVVQPGRTAAERLLLRIAIGAATDRLYLSYPRLDVAETRPRVPSFYALDVMRAVTGRVPDHRSLAREAAEEAGASLAWPAPADPARAVDDLEHDLSVLKPWLDTRDVNAVRGRAHYLLALNDALRRSVRSRWARGKPRWATSDGLIRVVDATRRALERQRLKARPYSVSALQRFATCPYQFLLATIHRLEPWEEPEPLLRMDPLTRGSLFHRAQAEFFRAMQAAGRLPVQPAGVADALVVLGEVVGRVAEEYAERLAPAIDRVWHDEIDEIRRDLGIWVQRLAGDRDWVPELFEFSFGLHDEGRDPRSLRDPVEIDGRFVLHGSVDLVERRPDGSALRVTDHKTGRNRSTPDLVIGGGAVLQPVLYSLAVERALGVGVAVGRLYYCTTAGGFGERPIPIDAAARAQGLEALTIIDRAVELGHLPAAPAPDGCRWCDFRPVCGPGEEARVARKPRALIADLAALREAR